MEILLRGFVGMRLDGNATTVASPASESLWGVGLLQTRERSYQGRIADRDNKEEGRRRAREGERERAQERKREGKLYSRNDARSQVAPVIAPSPPTFSLAPATTFSVGYALTSKKTKSFIQPKLEEHARY